MPSWDLYGSMVSTEPAQWRTFDLRAGMARPGGRHLRDGGRAEVAGGARAGVDNSSTNDCGRRAAGHARTSIAPPSAAPAPTAAAAATVSTRGRDDLRPNG